MSTVALNNREIAALIWIGIGLVLALHGGLGPSFLGIARTLISRVGVALLALVAYVAVVLLGLSELNLWGFALLPDAVVWTVAVALPLFGAAVTRDPAAMRHALAAAVSLTVAVEVFVNLEVASLPVELVALPVITLLTLIPIVAQGRPESAAAGPAEWMLAVIGIAAVVFVVVGIASDWQGLDKLEAVREFLLPVALTLALLPFLRVVWAYSAFDSARARRRVTRAVPPPPGQPLA